MTAPVHLLAAWQLALVRLSDQYAISITHFQSPTSPYLISVLVPQVQNARAEAGKGCNHQKLHVSHGLLNLDSRHRGMLSLAHKCPLQ
uniref:Putative secreted protein n=1 Tax=Ixodes ricinus TaxID=34613 RepID=A0A6B0UAS9_IXORI